MQPKPKLLVSPEQLNGYWPQIEPLLLSAPVSEDMTPDEIRNAVMNGNMLIFITEIEEPTGPLVEMMMLLAPGPQGFTIITIAGKNLKKHINALWDYFKGWCAMNGARAIDAYVPEYMEGLVAKLGFKRKSVHVRLTL